jgi:hypothetical protein
MAHEIVSVIHERNQIELTVLGEVDNLEYYTSAVPVRCDTKMAYTFSDS